ncbi:MAG: ABC transporter permease, partial [Paludibacter sp.]
MIIAVAVVVGFKKEIRQKTIGFGSHIQITNFDNNNSYQMQPIRISDSLTNLIQQIPNVKNVQPFITKPGIIKTATDFQGMVLKGVDERYDWTFFRNNLIEGEIPTDSNATRKNEAFISQTLAQRLNLKLGDSFLTYFMQEKLRVRKFIIKGIYSTNFSEYDELFILTNIKTSQKLNGWNDNVVSGLEINIEDFSLLQQVYTQIYRLVANQFDENGNGYAVLTIEQLNPQIFNWLELIDMNVWIILILMTLVAGFNIISGLLILILEKTNMIGVLKSLGTTDWSVRKIFLYQLLFIISKGMLWGNIVGISICWLQKTFHIIPLDPASYYINTVPIDLNIFYILLLNIGTIMIATLMLI